MEHIVMGEHRSDPTGRSARLVTRGRKLLTDWDDESDIDRAEHLFRQAIQAAPHNAEAWWGLGDALQEKEEYEDAAEAYAYVVSLGRADAILWSSLGTALAWIPQRAGESVDAVERAKSLAPDEIIILDRYANVLTRAGVRDASQLLVNAEDALRHRLALTPSAAQDYDSMEARIGHAGLLLYLKRPHDALTEFEHIDLLLAAGTGVLADKYRAIANLGRSFALAQLGKMDEALVVFDRAAAARRRLEPLWRAFHAELLVRNQQPLQAVDEAEAALNEYGEFAYLWQAYAGALEAAGRTKEAAAAMATARQKQAQHTPVHLLLPDV